MNYKKVIISFVAVVAIIAATSTSTVAQNQIQWYGFEEALQINNTRAQQGLPPKKIFIDVYTDWCGWCKRMDAGTFSHPEIAKYMSMNYLNVKLNAERTDTVRINNQVFTNQAAAQGKRGTHDLAAVLLKGKMSYPSFTIIDEAGKQLDVIPGYKDAKAFELIVNFIGENAYKTTSFEEYSKTFQSKIQ
jgi:thioredoxin-related protein